jgi:uncharacterized delta-60 repeat protein
MKENILSILLVFTSFIYAQQPGDVATNFGQRPGFNGEIYAQAIQSDGKILVGGAFSSYKSVERNGIIRLNVDGTVDEAFNVGIRENNGYIKSILIQNDGKIILGGNFGIGRISSQYTVKRFNTNGTVDTTFNLALNFDNEVYSMAIRNDGKILVSGSFTICGGAIHPGILCLDSNGSLDSSFTSDSSFTGVILSITIQSDNKILIGGSFTSYNGNIQNRIVRLNIDGSSDNTFNTGTGFDDFVSSIFVQSDGKIIVGGSFYKYNQVSQSKIVRLNTNGSLDDTFNAFADTLGGVVRSISAQTDGKIIVAGLFSSFNGVTQFNIARLNIDGSIDTNFVNGSLFDDQVYSIVIQTDGKILVGGSFNMYQGNVQNRIVRIDTYGNRDLSLDTGTGFNYLVNCIVPQNDNKVIIAGNFTTYKAERHNKIVRLNPNDTVDSTFNSGVGFGVDDYIKSIKIQSDGKILVGGDFSSYNSVSKNNIVRLNPDGTIDETFKTGNGFTYDVSSIAIQNDGKILVAGSFDKYNNVICKNIVRLNIDGTIDPNFNFQNYSSAQISCLTIQTDGKILVGGGSFLYNERNYQGIIRLNTDGLIDTTFNIGTGFTNSVYSIVIQPDNKIIVGGGFYSYNGVSKNSIARLNIDGSLDTTFVSGIGFSNYVNSIAIQDDNKILIGGAFTNYDAISSNKIIRLNPNGTVDTTFVTGSGFDNEVYSIAVQQDDDILVGGNFTKYNASSLSTSLIRIKGDTNILSDQNFKTVSTTFKLYPNPAKNTLNIDFENAGKDLISYEIYSLTGMQIAKDIFDKSSQTNTINTETLPSGSYLLKINTGKQSTSEIFIKE